MRAPQSKGSLLYVLLLLLTAFIAFLEYGLGPCRGSSLLMTLVFWTAIVEGCIAVAAICDLVNAKWIVTLKKELLSPVPLLLLLALLFALLGPRMEFYPWMKEEGVWLNKPFFLIRNVAILFITYLIAGRYASLSGRGDERTKTYAVIYLLIFVVSQSMVAFDWVMSLEYPWYSTLFGAYFFVEAVFCGLAVSGILYLIRYRKREGGNEPGLKGFLRDIATLMFGFSILWGGLFFTQFLVIWYGNLPEEVVYIVERVTDSPYRELSYLVVVCFFAAPFFLLLPRKTKTAPFFVAAVSLAIPVGLFVERYLFLKPVLPLQTGIFLLEFLGMLLLFIISIQRGRGGRPSSATEKPET